MKIYCFYGIGVPTERTYYYAVANEEDEETCADGNHTTGCTHEVASEHQTEQPTEQPTTAFTHHPIPTKPVNLVCLI
jgi:phospholipid:diacylglycerol acyltransferase